MRNTFVLIVLIATIAVAAGVIMLGAFPPDPHPHPVQKVLPNDRFQPR